MITIIDYGLGNLLSIQNMLKKAGYASTISSEENDIASASKLILPGVGAFDAGITNLRQRKLIDIIYKKVLEDNTPLLGICLGMQLMTKSSEEGKLPGLGLIDAQTIRLSFNDKNIKIPHMGWNIVEQKKESSLFYDMDGEKRFYFVHSYHVVCNDNNDILSSSPYGFDFTSSFERKNIVGVQFHPEKSHTFGMKLLRNFIEKY